VNFAALSLVDFIGFSLGFLLTILVFSYLLGDNPFFRLAIHIFIGVSAAYAAIITVNNVLIPRLITPLFQGSSGERLLSILLIIPSLFLLTKATPLRKAGNWTVAILVGIGSATAIGGAVTGTLFPQVLGTINAVDPGARSTLVNPWMATLNGAVIVLGTVTTLIYFHFGIRVRPGQPDQRPALVEQISRIGQIFLAVTFGALFAGVYLAALSAFVERLTFLWDFLNSMGVQLFS
jgi:hypothetical protein